MPKIMYGTSEISSILRIWGLPGSSLQCQRAARAGAAGRPSGEARPAVRRPDLEGGRAGLSAAAFSRRSRDAKKKVLVVLFSTSNFCQFHEKQII